MGKGQLTDKQRAFVDEYLIDLNATQAAIRAGYSPKTAEKQGSLLLHKNRVSAEIARAKAERSRRTGINADRVLQELARIALCNPNEVLDMKTAEVKAGASADDLRAISSVKVKYVPHKEYDEDGEVTVIDAIEREVRMCDKLKALDMLAKHLGMYEKNAPEDGEEGVTGVVEMPPVMDAPEPPKDTGALEGEGGG